MKIKDLIRIAKTLNPNATALCFTGDKDGSTIITEYFAIGQKTKGKKMTLNEAIEHLDEALSDKSKKMGLQGMQE